MSKRFAYALEPLRLQRSWALNDARMALAACAGRLAEHAGAVRDAEARADAALRGWRAAFVAKGGLQPQLLATHAAFLERLEYQLSAARERLAEAEREHDAQLERTAQATRALEALAEHKNEEHAAFHAERGKADMIEADDQWTIVQGRMRHAREG